MLVQVQSILIFESILLHLNLLKEKAPNVAVKKSKHLEDYMKGIVERRLETMSTLVSRGELRAEILNGMTATWHLLSPQFQHSW